MNEIKKGVFLTNDQYNDLYFEKDGLLVFNHSSIVNYTVNDLIIVETPFHIVNKSIMIDKTTFKGDHSLTLFMRNYEIAKLKDYVNQTLAMNQTLSSFFMQISSLNCEKINGFVLIL